MVTGRESWLTGLKVAVRCPVWLCPLGRLGLFLGPKVLARRALSQRPARLRNRA